MRRIVAMCCCGGGGGGGITGASSPRRPTVPKPGPVPPGSGNGSGSHTIVTHPANAGLAWPPSPEHSLAYIEEIRAISPTVKQVKLRLCGKSDPPRPPFAFKAGQWVDFYIQGMKRCGGYSMVSAPEELPSLTLAVKASSFSEPAQWVHEAARPYDHVAMKVGGSFFFEMTPAHWESGTRLVLLAGGVGVNPIMSILHHVDAWLTAHAHACSDMMTTPSPSGGGGFRVSLVCSAAVAEELLFKADIEAVARRHPQVIDAQFICTRDPSWGGRSQRMDGPLLWSLLPPEEEQDRALVYVCGPAAMIDDVERTYLSTEEGGGHAPPPPPTAARAGRRRPLRKEQIQFEKWW